MAESLKDLSPNPPVAKTMATLVFSLAKSGLAKRTEIMITNTLNIIYLFPIATLLCFELPLFSSKLDGLLFSMPKLFL
jgi:hypothetical protein